MGIPECIVPRDICGMRSDAGAIRIIDDAYAVARANPKCSDTVGGPIDIAKIDAAGRISYAGKITRWVSHWFDQ